MTLQTTQNSSNQKPSLKKSAKLTTMPLALVSDGDDECTCSAYGFCKVCGRDYPREDIDFIVGLVERNNESVRNSKTAG